MLNGQRADTSQLFETSAPPDSHANRKPKASHLCSIMYWLMGLRADGAKFLLFLVIMVMVAMTAGEVCSCISLMTACVGVANFMSIVVMLLMILFTGKLLWRFEFLEIWRCWCIPMPRALAADSKAIVGLGLRRVGLRSSVILK